MTAYWTKSSSDINNAEVRASSPKQRLPTLAYRPPAPRRGLPRVPGVCYQLISCAVWVRLAGPYAMNIYDCIYLIVT